MLYSNKIHIEDIEQITEAPIPWPKLKKKTILVTGANGFIPSYLVDTLVFLNRKIPGMDMKIFALVRNRRKAKERFETDNVEKGFDLIVQDVSEPLSLDSRVDYFIHAASQAAPNYYGSDPVGTLTANVMGTYQLLEHGRRFGTDGFLFVSSGEVYGETDSAKLPTGEQDYGYLDPLNVRSCYAESKRMAENMCVSWCHQYGLKVKIVRPFHTYGPGIDLNDVRCHSEFVASVINKKNISLSSDGSAVRCFCYIADTISAFFWVLLSGKDGQAYNVSSDEGQISIKELAELVASMFPERGINVKTAKQERPADYIQSPISKTIPDISKLKSLGWYPKTTLKNGFKRTIEAYL